MSLKSSFREQFPRAFFLDGENLISLERYLNDGDRLSDKEKIISTSKPREGNMNYVLRITTNHRSFIIKQARPWVEKYPQIPAPVERSVVESTFLQKAQKEKELARFSPKLLWSDPDNFILAMEDLGEATDYTFLYKKENKISTSDLENATKYLKILHRLPLDRFPENAKMRKLNHEHIFDFPFQKDNGLDLDQIQKGLNAVAAPFKADGFLKNKIQRLGAIYLAQGRCLIHGDFYPGSWLKSPEGIRVIDPEFAFHGPPEFDLAIMFAHMLMAKQDPGMLRDIWAFYQEPANFDQGLLSAFTGVEIMRRLIGIAQLPLDLTIAEKVNLMANASEWIRKENLMLKHF